MMKDNFKKKSIILMVICFLIPDIRLWMLLSNSNIYSIVNQKLFRVNDLTNIRLLVILPAISIIEALIFISLFFFVKSKNIWNKIYIFMIVLLVISVFGFLLSIYNFA